MRLFLFWATAAVFLAAFAFAQQSSTSPSDWAPASSATSGSAIPPLIKFSGALKDAQGKPRNGIVGIIFALYNDQEGGAPLWQESQNLTVDSSGNYTVVLGANTPQGLPIELFSSGQARWLGILVDSAEQPRVLLVSVPYALKAAGAESLGGIKAEDYVTSQALTSGYVVSRSGTIQAKPTTASSSTFNAVDSGTPGFLAKFLADGTTLAGSIASDSGTSINVAGSLTFPVAGPRIIADMSSFPHSKRLLFQSSVTNGISTLGALPNGTGTASAMNVYSSSDPDNASLGQFRIDAGQGFGMRSVSNGSGLELPIFFQIGTNEAMHIGTNLNVGIGTSTPGERLDVNGNLRLSNAGARIRGDMSSFPHGNRMLFQTTAANGLTTVGALPNGTGTASAMNVYSSSDPDNASLGQFRIDAGQGFGMRSISNGSGLQLPILFQIGTTEAMRIATNLNVGIRTTNPTAPLEVAGNLKVGGAGSVLIFPDGSSMSSANGIGTITAITAGQGLTGGGTSGNIPMALDVNYVGARYAGLSGGNALSGSQTVAGILDVTAFPTAIIAHGDSPAILGMGSVGVKGVDTTHLGRGVWGDSSLAGVYGTSDSGMGVWGVNSGGGSGVRGDGVTGVLGLGNNLGNTVGVKGISSSSSGIGIEGSGGLYGVHAVTSSVAGAGVFAESNAPSTGAVAIRANANGPSGTAIAGVGEAWGVIGQALGIGKLNGGIGIDGSASASSGIGVRGTATNANAVPGLFWNSANGGIVIGQVGSPAKTVFYVDGLGDVTATAFVGNGSGLTNVSANNVNGVSGSALATRSITYLAGCDSCSSLSTADSQASVYVNLIGSLTITLVQCFTDTGTAHVNLNLNGGANFLPNDLICSSAGASSGAISQSSSLNDRLNFRITQVDGISRRITLAIKAFVN